MAKADCELWDILEVMRVHYQSVIQGGDDYHTTIPAGCVHIHETVPGRPEEPHINLEYIDGATEQYQQIDQHDGFIKASFIAPTPEESFLLKADFLKATELNLFWNDKAEGTWLDDEGGMEFDQEGYTIADMSVTLKIQYNTNKWGA